MEMKDFMRKGMLFGIGLAAVTKEKIEEAVEEMIRKGELSEKEGKEAIDDLVKKSKEVTQELTEKVETIVADTLKKFNCPTRDEYSELKKRIEKLEKAHKSEE